MRSKTLLLVPVFVLAGFVSVESSDRSEENLRRYFENEPVLLKINVPADKNGINYYPFRQDKKLDYVGRGVGIFKGSTATIYRVKVLSNYVEIQFNEGGGTTAGRILSRSDWPFGGKSYGGRINVHFERRVSVDDLAVSNMVKLTSPLFCLVKDYEKNCFAEELPEKAAVPEPARRPAPTLQLQANPRTIQRGECTALFWSSSNADTVEIGDLGILPLEGDRDVCPQETVCYEGIATGSGGSATDTACITVSGPTSDDFDRGVRDVFFALDQSRLSPEAITTLQSNIRWLKDHADVRFVLEGHADERATAQYNLDLGRRRAEAVRDYLIRNGISADRFSIVSFGEERPFANCPREDCWWQNRRVHFSMP